MFGRERIVAAINILAAVLLAATVGMMTVQLVLRAIFNAPITWVEEVVRYCFVWAVYLGSVLALVRDSHIRVLVVVERFGKTGQMWSDRLTRLVNIIVFAYLFYWSVDLAWKYRATEFYTLPGVPQLVFYLSIPVSTAITLCFLLFPDRATRHDGLPAPEL